MLYGIIENGVLVIRDEQRPALPAGAKLLVPEFISFCKKMPLPTQQEVMLVFNNLG